jgi:hypothetical protein
MRNVVTQEVLRLLGLDCARKILDGLAAVPEGLTDRQISADVVGSATTEKTVIQTRKRLTTAGWISAAGEPESRSPGGRGRKAQRWKISPFGEEARHLAIASDRVHAALPDSPRSTRSGGVGVR